MRTATPETGGPRTHRDRSRDGVEAGEALLERPLTARSVVASLLLGVWPPRLPVARIVAWCREFGIADGTTRVALSRMVERGELRAAGGSYELAGRLAERQAEQAFALAPELRDWDGAWRLGVVAGPPRSPADRAELRTAARRAHFAELREGVWTRPDNLALDGLAADVAVLDHQLAWWTGRPDEDARALAERLFAPAAWAARARQLADGLSRATESLGDGGPLAPAFVAGAAALQHVRRDPMLPRELLPDARPADALRARYREYQAAFDAAARAFARAAG